MGTTIPEQGEPVRGITHSTDASSGVQITLYNLGETADARTLGSNEQLVITNVSLITAAGGDAYIHVGADATAAAGEYVIRGTYAANGGESKRVFFAGEKGHNAFVVAPAGVVDVIIEGYIRKVDDGGQRPEWKESQVPGA